MAASFYLAQYSAAFISLIKEKGNFHPSRVRTADGQSVDFKISLDWSVDPQRLSADYWNFFVNKDNGLIYDIGLGVKYFAYKGVNAALSTVKAADITVRSSSLAEEINKAVLRELQRYPINVGTVSIELYL